MADEASTAEQVVTERGAAEPPPAALTRKCDEDAKASMDVVAETLTAHGFDVLGPDWEDSRLLRVMGLRDRACEITVEDSGFVTWEYRSGAGDGIDPDKITGRVMRLLTNASGERQCWLGRAAPGAGLKGLVGCRLKAAMGLGVCLDVHEDHDTYEVVAEIIVTNPGRPERGQVRVSDDGALMWECGDDEDPIDTATIANMMATILTGDITDGCVQRGELTMAALPAGPSARFPSSAGDGDGSGTGDGRASNQAGERDRAAYNGDGRAEGVQGRAGGFAGADARPGPRARGDRGRDRAPLPGPAA